MILEKDFSTKYQIQGETTKQLIESLKSYVDHFEYMEKKLKGAKLVCTEPGHHTWQLETEDPQTIRTAKSFGFREALTEDEI
jgi:hypothetical protein